MNVAYIKWSVSPSSIQNESRKIQCRTYIYYKHSILCSRAFEIVMRLSHWTVNGVFVNYGIANNSHHVREIIVKNNSQNTNETYSDSTSATQHLYWAVENKQISANCRTEILILFTVRWELFATWTLTEIDSPVLQWIQTHAHCTQR